MPVSRAAPSSAVDAFAPARDAAALSPAGTGVRGRLQRRCACGSHSAGGGECRRCADARLNLQRKLTLGASNDAQELEADRIADQVLASPANRSGSPVRLAAPPGHAAADGTPLPSSVERVLAQQGAPLGPSLRQDMERRFGHDYANVRVHADSAAAESARAIDAAAYTVGRHVVFGAAQFAPESSQGRRLIAHELTHVLQQAGGSVAPASRPDRTRSAGLQVVQRQHAPDRQGILERLAELEARAARPVSLSPEETAALIAEREALIAQLRPESSAVRPAAPLSTPARTASAGAAPTPEDMVRMVVEQRQFSAVRPSPEGSTAPIAPEALAPEARGAAAGGGYQTNAVIQVVDADGRQVALELAQYEGHGQAHAEAQGVARLSLRLAGRRFPGGRMIVAVDQLACGGCLARLRALAVRLGLGSFEVWVPAPEEGRRAGPKWTARTATVRPARPSAGSSAPETGGAASYRASARMAQGETLPPATEPAPLQPRPQTLPPPRQAGPRTPVAEPSRPTPAAGETPVVEPPPTTIAEPAAEAAHPQAPRQAVPPEGAPPRSGGGWGGVGSGLLSIFGPLAVGWIHQSAVRSRVREQAGTQGYVPQDAPSGEGLLYDLGAWLIDPMRDAERAVPGRDRIDVRVWRARLRTAATSRRAGETMSIRWDIGRCSFDELGRQRMDHRTVVYLKQADGSWRVQSGDARGTPSLQAVLSPDVPDAAISALIFDDPCEA
ncbi:eCIS core domain-containing protein [Variovorax sp. JS1663]|uniref:eCIS core domain-containing protein n=1 Tax=Variovorax sp. JS1663 TaxID=1851577 RepID=UPI000B340F9E|nr:DUF4157 domain-containing protein [Variovorax sp. JS1663]OUL98517.1 hypothetical protein A8M77_31125 [Variovorax sp. JS1663]